jgi:uncharacterized protein YbbK (DUF523 family)
MKSTARPDAEGDRRRVSGIRIGISACLLGQEVRFDGGHKKDAFLTDVLGAHVEWVPVCPEVEVGMGTPRETLRLVRENGRIRMVTTHSLIDHTDAMNAWAERRVEALTREDLDGYVLKKDSPSCGMERVTVHQSDGSGVGDGRGLFADALIRCLPLLPVEEEGRLRVARLRESFIERVFAYRRFKDLFASRWSIGALLRFHEVHRASLLAHSTSGCEELERLLTEGAHLPKPELRARYEALFMTTLAVPATTRRHTAALSDMARQLKDRS